MLAPNQATQRTGPVGTRAAGHGVALGRLPAAGRQRQVGKSCLGDALPY